MKTHLILTASAFALATMAQPGWSLTAEEAWEGWITLSEQYGQTMSAESTSKSGNALTASGVTYAIEDAEIAIMGKTAEIVLTEQADGSVKITGADQTELTVNVTPDSGENFDGKVLYKHPDLSVTVSDAGGAMTYDYALPSLGFELTEAIVDGKPVPVKFTASTGSVTGRVSVTGASPVTVTQSYNVSNMIVNLDGRDPETGGVFDMDMSLASLAGNGTTTGGSIMGAGDDLPQMLKDGLAGQGSALVGPAEIAIVGNGPDGAFDMKFGISGANGAGSLDKDKVNYSINYNDFAIAVSGDEIPLPVIEANLGQLGLTLLMPLAQTSEPAPFVLNTKLEDLTIADPIWNLLDPAAVLPRDPADLIINLAGQAKWLVDILDPNMEDVEVPGEIHALSISEILLSVAGASLSGSGGFTFDNTDFTTFDGIPRPAGSIDLKLVGGNGLLDKLVQMGLLPQDQAMGVRMMSGAFLRPGDGPDTLTSEIQITPTGQILANGQALPF